MDISFLSSLMLSENFWHYIKYVAIALALIPIAVNLKDGYYSDDKYKFLSLLFLTGAIGIIYSMYREWSAIPSDGFGDYLKFAFYSFVFILIPFFNFIETPAGYFDEKPVYDFLSNGLLCLLFLLWGLYGICKALISIPPDGFVYFLGLMVVCVILALICFSYRKHIQEEHDTNIITYYTTCGFFALFTIGAVYFLVKTVLSIPPIVYVVTLGFIAWALSNSSDSRGN